MVFDDDEKMAEMVAGPIRFRYRGQPCTECIQGSPARSIVILDKVTLMVVTTNAIFSLPFVVWNCGYHIHIAPPFWSQ